MKKSQAHLLKLAAKFGNKYAQSQSLQQIIENAASYGKQNPNGIMNFIDQLEKDKAALTIGVDVRIGMWGGRTIYVTNPYVRPQSFTSHYSELPAQIKNYLENNLDNFPQVPIGQTNLQWDKSEHNPIAQK